VSQVARARELAALVQAEASLQQAVAVLVAPPSPFPREIRRDQYQPEYSSPGGQSNR
jgi:hypothetical protein